jgi:hypothetical protein
MNNIFFIMTRTTPTTELAAHHHYPRSRPSPLSTQPPITTIHAQLCQPLKTSRLPLSCWNLLRSEAVAIEILHDWLGDAAHF